MASSALEAKIIKIKLQNEEIRRRHEEVEADKKNAAKLNALVKMVPSDDWPERKEPPEFSAPAKLTQKQKALNKEHNDRPPQHYSGIQDRLGKKDHKFAQGDGPPPDPKYNFLADSEREIRITDNSRVDESKNRSRNKASRGSKKRGGDSGGGSRDAYFKDNRGPHAFYSREEALPEYEAWRAERNRIDEARISRQKTAEGNWRREWDSNKTNVEKDPLRKGDSNRKESNNYDRRNNHYDSDYSNRGHGGSRTYHGSQKNHNQDYRRSHHEQIHEYKRQLDNKPPLSPNDDRTVTATDKSIKVTLNHGNQTKGPVMSVKVNSPSIAGTGRVGPRQKSRVTYSSQSDADVTVHELNNFSRQKSFDEKTAGAYFNSGQKSTPKSPFSQRKKDSNSKSAYNQRKEFKNDESSTRTKIAIKTTYSQRNESKDQRQLNNLSSKVQRIQKRSQKQCVINKEESLSISDEAIPCEYNPDKSFNAREDVNKEKLDTEYENFEKISGETNEIDEEFSENFKTYSNSDSNDKLINQNDYDNYTENTNHQNSDNITVDEINKNNEHIEINENITDLKNNDYTDENFDNMDKGYETFENDKFENNIESSNILQDVTEQKNNDYSFADLDIIVGLTEQKNNLPMLTQEYVTQEDISHEKQIPSIETIKEKELIKNCENNETGALELEQKNVELKKLNDNFQPINIDLEAAYVTNCPTEQLIDNITNDFDESQGKKITQLFSLQNKLDNDSSFIDNNITNESIECDKIKAIEMVSFEKNSTNDSGFIDDFDKLQNNFDASIIESNDENNVANNPEKFVISDTMELTKEVCNKYVDICDIHSVASNELTQVIEDHLGSIESNIDEQVIKMISESHTKDNKICIVDDIDKSLGPTNLINLKLERQNELAEESFHKPEPERVVTEAAAVLDIVKSTSVASDESTNKLSDKSEVA